MSKHIKSTEQTWNDRVKEKMKEKEYTQRSFAIEYTNRFGTTIQEDGSITKKTTSQADVSRWTSVTDKDIERNKRGFPDFRTMKNIADILGVSVAYLIGETDNESFNLEKASKYIGLTPSTVRKIRRIAKPLRMPVPMPPYFIEIRDPRKKALELLISNPHFGDYLKDLHDLTIAIQHEKKEVNTLQYVADRIPKEYSADVFTVFDTIMKDEPIEKSGIQPSEDVMSLVELLELASDITEQDKEYASQRVEIASYTLAETHTHMVQEIIKNIRKSSSGTQEE